MINVSVKTYLPEHPGGGIIRALRLYLYDLIYGHGVNVNLEEVILEPARDSAMTDLWLLHMFGGEEAGEERSEGERPTPPPDPPPDLSSPRRSPAVVVSTSVVFLSPMKSNWYSLQYFWSEVSTEFLFHLYTISSLG